MTATLVRAENVHEELFGYPNLINHIIISCLDLPCQVEYMQPYFIYRAYYGSGHYKINWSPSLGPERPSVTHVSLLWIFVVLSHFNFIIQWVINFLQHFSYQHWMSLIKY